MMRGIAAQQELLNASFIMSRCSTQHSAQAIYASPAAVMVGGPSLYLIAPLPLPQASMDLTTLYDSTSPSGTPPKTTCLPSSHEVTTVVMKN
jgi:hypothetical protein